MKRFLALLLCLLMALSLIPAAAAEDIEIVEEEDLEALPEEGIEIVDTDEAEETNATGVVQKLQAVLNNYPNNSLWTDSFDGGKTCYGFAKLVIYNVFGKSTVSGKTYRSWTYAGVSSSGMINLGSVSTCSESNVKSLLSNARPGDVLQFDAGSNGHQHSMIIYSLTSTGAQIYECNWVASNKVSLTTLTYSQIAARQTRSDGTKRGKLSLLTSDNWETVNGGPYTPETPTLPSISGTSAGTTEGYPAGTLTKGQNFGLRGVISSNVTITNVSAYIYNATGSAIRSYSTNPNSTVYDIRYDGLNSSDQFKFATLDSGSYRYVVKATNTVGTATLIDSDFVVGAPTTYTVKYDANGGSGAPSSQIKTHNVSLVLSNTVPTRNGYSFKGWATSSSATTAQYQPGSSYTANTSVTLYAVWTKNPEKYTISYNANGGSGAPSSQEKTQGVNLTLSSTKPARAAAALSPYTVTLNANGGSVSVSALYADRTESYSFLCWNTRADGTGTTYQPGGIYSADTSAVLYAQWSSSVNTAAVSLPSASRAGYTFKGWSTSSTATEGMTAFFVPSGDVTLYAVWEKDPPLEPVIISQPSSKTVVAGSTVSFAVEATNATNFQWYYRTSSSGSWKKCTGTGYNTGVLTVEAKSYRNGYQYRCKVTNAAGYVRSNIVTLTVIGKPTITTQPTNKTIVAGETAKFTVKASGTGLSYQWYYRENSDSSWKKTSLTGNTTATLSVYGKTTRNGYQYRCKITNAAGYVRSNIVTLKVTAVTKPTITTQPFSKTAYEGDTVRFTVKASGTGLSYQWYYRENSSSSWKKTSLTGATTDALSVLAKTTRNGFQYRCKITNAAGYVYTNIVTLTVK